jgi:DNA-binding MarR family transcriptional regulator
MQRRFGRALIARSMSFTRTIAAMAKTATRKTKAANRDAKSASGSAANKTARVTSAATRVNKRRTHGVIAAAAGKSGSKPAAKMPKTRRTRDAVGDSGARVPVNQIIEQWQRERPDLDPAPMRLFGALAQAHMLTTPYINRVIARHGLVRGTFDVLSALRRAGLPFSLTPKQLAESLMLSGAGMTSRLDRLEQLHLVARLPEPNDRRSLKIQLTQKGVRLIDEVIPQIVSAQWQLVSALGDRDTATLVDLLRRLTETLFASIDPTDLD